MFNRYSYTNKKESLKLPKIDNRDTDIYIYANKYTRLDKLSLDYYNDMGYWWIICFLWFYIKLFTNYGNIFRILYIY